MKKERVTLEEEKKYRIILKTSDRILMLWQSTDEKKETDLIHINRITTGKTVFTEKEILKIDSRYMYFAEEVKK